MYSNKRNALVQCIALSRLLCIHQSAIDTLSSPQNSWIVLYLLQVIHVMIKHAISVNEGKTAKYNLLLYPLIHMSILFASELHIQNSAKASLTPYSPLIDFLINSSKVNAHNASA